MSVFTKKSFAELQAEADRGLLRRSLAPWHLTALGIGSIIGTGIFVHSYRWRARRFVWLKWPGCRQQRGSGW